MTTVTIVLLDGAQREVFRQDEPAEKFKGQHIVFEDKHYAFFRVKYEANELLYQHCYAPITITRK